MSTHNEFKYMFILILSNIWNYVTSALVATPEHIYRVLGGPIVLAEGIHNDIVLLDKENWWICNAHGDGDF